ncbi:MAG: biopolymer transporter Tol [Coleofasciculaceae cyanobacterium SM2_1_6]|nr:biopolymer transporter Tol [Coleofasciculaceae cyanobacterium SM2_1_6]
MKRLLLPSLGAVLVGLGGLLGACDQNPPAPSSINSRYTDEQPALSGNGQFVAFVSSRNGISQVLLYDLKARQFTPLPGLNSTMTIAQNPSLSRNARYVAYLAGNQGKPDLFIYDRVTQRSEVLTSGYRHVIRSPSLSPDGRYLVFETDRRGQWDIEVIDRGAAIELDKPEG